MTLYSFSRVMAVITKYVQENEDKIPEPLSFTSETLSLYVMNAESGEVSGFSEEILIETMEGILAKRRAGPPEPIRGTPEDTGVHIVTDDYEKLNSRRRRNGVCSRADPFAQIREYPKTPEVFEFLYEILQGTKLIARIMLPEQLKRLVTTMHLEEIKKGSQLITEGEYGDTMYLVESGRFQIIQKNKIVSVLRPKSLFGEISLLFSFPRTASVVCIEDAKVWVTTSNSYTAIQMANHRSDREMICRVLERNSKYASLSVKEKDQVLRITKLMHYIKEESLDALEEGVFMVMSPSVLMLLGDDEKETIVGQGAVVKKGIIRERQASFLFIPDSVCDAFDFNEESY